MLKRLFSRLTTLVVAGSLATGSMIIGATSAPAAFSNNTQTYCTGMKSGYTCSLSISSSFNKIEGQAITGTVSMRPNYRVTLRAFELQWTATGTPSGVKPVGAAFSVTTDANGRATFNAPTSPLVAPSTGGTGKFLVQASDFTLANFTTGHILGSSGRAPLFDLSSARALHYKTETHTRYGGGNYFTTELRYGIAGQRYEAQLFVGGRWINANESGIANNGVMSTYGNAYVQWAAPSSVGTGVYSMRIINVTKSQVIRTSSFAIYNGPSGVWGDQDGDKLADILAVDGSGRLLTYITRGGPSLSEGFNVGSGWAGMDWVTTLPDMDGNGYSELLARRKSDGTMWLYRGTNFGAYGSAKQVGKGWNGLDQLTILPDINGDKQPEMLARNSAGKLLRYKVTLTGAQYVNEVGSGWGSIIKVISLGDMTRDGVADFVAIAANGNLYRYSLNRSGKVVSTAHVGRYWQSMSQAFSPGDMDGDGIRDLVARRDDGTLFFYKNQGNGSFGAAKQIGTGWNGIRLFT